VLEIPGHDRAGGCLKGDFQEDDVVLVRRGLMRPRHGDQVLLKLQDRQKSFPPNLLDSESRTCQDLAVLDLDPVIERKPQASAKQDVDKSSGWSRGRKQAGHQDVGVPNPHGHITHAALSA